MLTRIHIRNFRSCVDVTLDILNHMVALIGRNGSGKTNILKAIDWMSKFAVKNHPPFISLNRGPELGNPSIAIEAKLDETEFRYNLSIEIKSPPPPASAGFQIVVSELLDVKESDAWTNLFDRSPTQISIPGRAPIQFINANGCIPVLLSILPQEDRTTAMIAQFSSFLSKIRYYPIDEPSDPNNPFDLHSSVQDSTYKQLLANSKSGPSFTNVLGQYACVRLVHMEQTEPNRIKALLDLIGAKGLKLIEDISVEKAVSAGKDAVYFVNFKLGENLGNGDKIFKYSDLSLGTRRILQILMSLVFDDSSVMLIEHPEDGVHCGLLTMLVSLMENESDPIQIIVSSHSETLLNEMKPESIKLVTLASSNNSAVRSLSADEIKHAKRYISQEGTLFEYLSTLQED